MLTLAHSTSLCASEDTSDRADGREAESEGRSVEGEDEGDICGAPAAAGTGNAGTMVQLQKGFLSNISGK